MNNFLSFPCFESSFCSFLAPSHSFFLPRLSALASCTLSHRILRGYRYSVVFIYTMSQLISWCITLSWSHIIVQNVFFVKKHAKKKNQQKIFSEKDKEPELFLISWPSHLLHHFQMSIWNNGRKLRQNFGFSLFCCSFMSSFIPSYPLSPHKIPLLETFSFMVSCHGLFTPHYTTLEQTLVQGFARHWESSASTWLPQQRNFASK